MYKSSIKEIKTQQVSVFPQYDYPDGVRTFKGQTASQTLIVTIKNINSSGGIIGPLID